MVMRGGNGAELKPCRKCNIESVEAERYEFCKRCWWDQDPRNTNNKKDLSWRAKARIAVRISNLELLSCDSRLCLEGVQDHLEICEWGKDSRWVIATLSPGSDGYTLAFVGERPLSDTVDWSTFREIVELGFRLSKTLQNER